MFNAKRIETIRKNVQISTLLSDHEKSDWLNLLELMNDKQLGELEEILASDPNVVNAATSSSPSPVASSPQSMPHTPQLDPVPQQPVQFQPLQSSQSQSEFVQQLPPLSHIANMPTDVTMTHSVPKAPASVPAPKPLPRVTPSPNLSSFPPKPNYVKPAAPSVARPVQVQPQRPVGQQRSIAPLKAQTQPQPKAQSQAVYSIKEPADLQQLTLESIRAYTFQSIFDVIRQTIQTNGYFPVLQLIESSALYESYITVGKERLGDTTQQSMLTQEEFEFMTDLLRNMRFNRW